MGVVSLIYRVENEMLSFIYLFIYYYYYYYLFFINGWLSIGYIAIPLVLVGETVWNYLNGVLRIVEQIVCVKEWFLFCFNCI